MHEIHVGGRCVGKTHKSVEWVKQDPEHRAIVVFSVKEGQRLVEQYGLPPHCVVAGLGPVSKQKDLYWVDNIDLWLQSVFAGKFAGGTINGPVHTMTPPKSTSDVYLLGGKVPHYVNGSPAEPGVYLEHEQDFEEISDGFLTETVPTTGVTKLMKNGEQVGVVTGIVSTPMGVYIDASVAVEPPEPKTNPDGTKCGCYVEDAAGDLYPSTPKVWHEPDCLEALMLEGDKMLEQIETPQFEIGPGESVKFVWPKSWTAEDGPWPYPTLHHKGGLGAL